MRLLTVLALTLISIQVAVELVSYSSAFGYAGVQETFVNMHSFEQNITSLRANSSPPEYLSFLGWSMSTSLGYIFDIIWNTLSGNAIKTLILAFIPDPYDAAAEPIATLIQLFVVAIFALALIETIRG